MILFSLAPQASVREDFEKGNSAYQEGRFDSAIVYYEAVADLGVQSAALCFNLGNAYFKSGDLGQAILFYLRARRMDPADEDIVSNLEFARSFTRVQMEGVRLNPINSFVESMVSSYRIDTLAWISSLFFILLFGFLSVRFGLGITNPGVRVGLALAVIFLLLSSLVTTFKYRTDYLTRRAVLVADEVPILTGPSADLDIELQGAPGLVVEILSESGDWYNVSFENKRRGWVLKELVAEV